jgi:hypothetical protein
LVIDCTTIGAPPPTATLPTMTCVVLCRPLGPATSFGGGLIGLFMGSRISGFDDIHQGVMRGQACHAKREHCEPTTQTPAKTFTCLFNSLLNRLGDRL